MPEIAAAGEAEVLPRDGAVHSRRERLAATMQ
jgi:hypothetical protein